MHNGDWCVPSMKWMTAFVSGMVAVVCTASGSEYRIAAGPFCSLRGVFIGFLLVPVPHLVTGFRIIPRDIFPFSSVVMLSRNVTQSLICIQRHA